MPSKFDADPDRVFDEAYGVRLNYKKMKKLEKEYTTMKVKEKEDEIELRVSTCLELVYALDIYKPWVCPAVNDHISGI